MHTQQAQAQASVSTFHSNTTKHLTNADQPQTQAHINSEQHRQRHTNPGPNDDNCNLTGVITNIISFCISHLGACLGQTAARLD